MFSNRMRDISMSIPWNLFLLTLGGILFALGMKSIAMPHAFLAGGLFGTGQYIFYMTDTFSTAAWYVLLNIPIFIIGWLFVSRRFFCYSLYGMLVTTLATQYIPIVWPIQDPLLAAVASGVVCGAGLGIVLHSLGSDGGLTIIAIILHQRWSVRIGQFNTLFNFFLFGIGLLTMQPDQVIYSIIMVFTYSTVADNVHSMFNQRKMVIIISSEPEQISKDILVKLHRGVTFLHGEGAFTGNPKKVILTIVPTLQIKKLEEIVFGCDPNAFVIIENTFNVLGTGFSRRKVY